jgi:hypothetical protein
MSRMDGGWNREDAKYAKEEGEGRGIKAMV